MTPWPIGFVLAGLLANAREPANPQQCGLRRSGWRAADPSELHPAERLLEDEPSGPGLWPKGIGNYLP